MADFNDWIKHAFGIGPDPDEQMKPPPPGATDAENAPRLPSWSNHEPPEGATMQQVAQAGEDLADEIAEARQRNRRTAEFATKMGAPVTRNPVRFERDSRKQQAVAYLQGEKERSKQAAAMDPKVDWDSIDREAAKEPRRVSAEDHFRRDSAADQAAVKRGYEDAAGRQADALMAQYQTQMAQPSAVAARLEDQAAQEDVQRRLLAIEWLRGGR
jgi:hypothetical protein